MRKLSCVNTQPWQMMYFTSIMHLETTKKIWDEPNKRHAGDERVCSIKLLTLNRKFKMLKVKENESVKEYNSKLYHVVNQMQLYGEVVDGNTVVEAKVSATEESCDLKKLIISEMVNNLHAKEQRIPMRMDDETKGVFQARHKGRKLFGMLKRRKLYYGS